MKLSVVLRGIMALFAGTEAQDSFMQHQLEFGRVRAARNAWDTVLSTEAQSAGVAWPPRDLLLRIHKHQGEVEVWAAPVKANQNSARKLWKTIPTCAMSGDLGPKRFQGDKQVPEGIYSLSAFNPQSSYHLSLRVDYPNEEDRAWQSKNGQGRDPGGDIYIHGNCVSIGCVAIEDGPIAMLYWIAVRARAAGQAKIPIHIFPTRMDEAGMQFLRQNYSDSQLLEFWEKLRLQWAKEPPKN